MSAPLSDTQSRKTNAKSRANFTTSEKEQKAQVSAPKLRLCSPPSSSLVVADPGDVPSPDPDGPLQVPSQDRTLQLNADVSLERTEQRPPERSLIEQEGQPISPICTSEANGTVDALQSNTVDEDKLRVKASKKSKKKKGNGVKKFFKKMLKNMFEERREEAAAAPGAGLAGREQENDGRKEQI